MSYGSAFFKYGFATFFRYPRRLPFKLYKPLVADAENLTDCIGDAINFLEDVAEAACDSSEVSRTSPEVVWESSETACGISDAVRVSARVLRLFGNNAEAATALRFP